MITSGRVKACASSQTWMLLHAEKKRTAANLGILHGLPHMLSQNRARVLGFSWLRRCLNQRCMVLTSQSSCLDRPSNLFSSGCWQHNADTVHVSYGVHRATNAMRWNAKNNEENADITLVIAVKTFSRIALDCAFCGPLAWIFRPMAHGLAINLKLKVKTPQ